MGIKFRTEKINYIEDIFLGIFYVKLFIIKIYLIWNWALMYFDFYVFCNIYIYWKFLFNFKFLENFKLSATERKSKSILDLKYRKKHGLVTHPEGVSICWIRKITVTFLIQNRSKREDYDLFTDSFQDIICFQPIAHSRVQNNKFQSLIPNFIQVSIGIPILVVPDSSSSPNSLSSDPSLLMPWITRPPIHHCAEDSKMCLTKNKTSQKWDSTLILEHKSSQMPCNSLFRMQHSGWRALEKMVCPFKTCCAMFLRTVSVWLHKWKLGFVFLYRFNFD